MLATGGLNVRESASSKAKQVGRLGGNTLVTVLEGPTQADNYDWYRVDNGAGVVGWVAAGPQNDPWLRIEAAGGLPDRRRRRSGSSWSTERSRSGTACR